MKLPTTNANSAIYYSPQCYIIGKAYNNDQGLVNLATATVYATPSCDGIEAAYQILGKRCATQYDKINHNLDANATCEELQKTYRARVDTMKIFKNALDCNGINGAKTGEQNKFRKGEEGHISAIDALKTRIENMNGCAVPYNGETIENILGDTVIRKQQCK